MTHRAAKILVGALVAFLCVATLPAMSGNARAEPYETGFELAPLSEARVYSGAAFGNNGLLYVMGGYDSSSAQTLNTVLVYNVTSGVTTRAANMTYGVINAGCAKGLDGRIFMVGGFNTTLTYPMIIQIFNTTSGLWTTGAGLPRSMYWTAAATGHDGRIFAFGGNDIGVAINSTLIYDPKLNSWSYGADLPTHRWGASAVTLANGSIALVGGGNESGVLKSVEIYNPVTNSWSNGEPLNNGKNAAGAALGANGRLYSFGGSPFTFLFGSPPTAAVESSDGGPWVVSSFSLTEGKSGFGTAVDSYGRIFIVGGVSAATTIANVEYIITTEITGVQDLSITSPSNGAIVSGTISVEAALKNDLSGTPSVLSVDFLVDGVWKESQTPAFSWIFLWDTSGLADMSTHKLSVRAFFQDSTVKEVSVTVTVWSLSPEARIALIEAEIAALQAHLTTQDANVTQMRVDLAIIQAQLTGLGAGLTAIGQGLATMGAGQVAFGAQMNVTLALLQGQLAGFQTQLDDFQVQIDRVEGKADNAGMIGIVTVVLIIIVIVILVMMFMAMRKKA